jgi:DNA-binding SARP family transcriptional activator
VRIFTLGRFALEFDDQRAPASRKESRKALDLLKLLVTLGRGNEVSTDRLISLLWPGTDSIAARHSFENTLFQLRKIVGEKQLQMRSRTLSLNPAHCWSDLNALELTLNSALPVDGNDALTLLELTMQLYNGPFLPGEDRYASVVLMRDRLQSRFLRRMEVLGGVLEADGRFDACVLLYRRMLEQNPLAENIYRRLIFCLLQLDCHAEALEAYRRCRQQLSIVLGIQPSPVTDALVNDLRKRSSATENR